ncbi:MAG: hypothetical protein KDK72_10505 [Chlamydiia bacterium]|nr:hypothetical protein [Chlamydiia bacterium]
METFADIDRDKFPLVSEAVDILNEIAGKKVGDVDYGQLNRLKQNLNDYLSEPHASPESLQDAIKNFRSTLRFHHPKTKPLKPVMGKKQAVARSKVIDLFRKAFKDPIRLGKFKQRAQGIHKMWPRVTRLLKANDVETASHEIGHNLHTVLYGGDAKTAKDQQANVIKSLKPFLNELKPIAGYEPYTLEGFAEFT